MGCTTEIKAFFSKNIGLLALAGLPLLPISAVFIYLVVRDLGLESQAGLELFIVVLIPVQIEQALIFFWLKGLNDRLYEINPKENGGADWSLKGDGRQIGWKSHLVHRGYLVYVAVSFVQIVLIGLAILISHFLYKSVRKVFGLNGTRDQSSVTE